jgi:P pilus assembly chaperone PapD
MALTATAFVLAAGALVPALTTPAHATAKPPAEAAAEAPSCVRPDLDESGWTDYLTVTNTCGYYVRVKVVLANASDLACNGYDSGQSRSWQWGFPGRFDGLQTC